MMTIRTYSPEDYPMLCRWWNEHGNGAPHESIIPALGVMALDSAGEPCAAVWAYMDNSRSIAFLAFPTTRPGLAGRAAIRALNAAMDFLEPHLKEDLGYSHLAAFLAPGSLLRYFERRGYKAGLAEHIHCIKAL